MRSEGYSSWSVCLFVCLSTTILPLQATRAIPTASVLQGHENVCGDFAETTAFERYGVKKAICIISTGLPRQSPALLQRSLARFFDDRGF